MGNTISKILNALSQLGIWIMNHGKLLLCFAGIIVTVAIIVIIITAIKKGR